MERLRWTKQEQLQWPVLLRWMMQVLKKHGIAVAETAGATAMMEDTGVGEKEGIAAAETARAAAEKVETGAVADAAEMEDTSATETEDTGAAETEKTGAAEMKSNGSSATKNTDVVASADIGSAEAEDTSAAEDTEDTGAAEKDAGAVQLKAVVAAEPELASSTTISHQSMKLGHLSIINSFVYNNNKERWHTIVTTTLCICVIMSLLELLPVGKSR